MAVGAFLSSNFALAPTTLNRFPIQEHGMNYLSQPLQPHEIESIKLDPEAIRRLIRSYELMLDFYGMRLVSEQTRSCQVAHVPVEGVISSAKTA